MAYFKNVNTLEELRKQYKELLKKFHPDNANGSTEATQEINSEYDTLFKVLKNRHEKQTSTSDKEADFNNKHYDFTEDKILREMLQKIIHFSNMNIEICGSWIWCFNSYEYRNELKELGFHYASKKKAWYWHTETFKKKRNRPLSMDEIREFYGSSEVKTEGRKLLKQA